MYSITTVTLRGKQNCPKNDKTHLPASLAVGRKLGLIPAYVYPQPETLMRTRTATTTATLRRRTDWVVHRFTIVHLTSRSNYHRPGSVASVGSMDNFNCMDWLFGFCVGILFH